MLVAVAIADGTRFRLEATFKPCQALFVAMEFDCETGPMTEVMPKVTLLQAERFAQRKAPDPVKSRGTEGVSLRLEDFDSQEVASTRVATVRGRELERNFNE